MVSEIGDRPLKRSRGDWTRSSRLGRYYPWGFLGGSGGQLTAMRKPTRHPALFAKKGTTRSRRRASNFIYLT